MIRVRLKSFHTILMYILILCTRSIHLKLVMSQQKCLHFLEFNSDQYRLSDNDIALEFFEFLQRIRHW